MELDLEPRPLCRVCRDRLALYGDVCRSCYYELKHTDWLRCKLVQREIRNSWSRRERRKRRVVPVKRIEIATCKVVR